jgi:3'-phosphoadenosine 5'-phosphosulfate sulfotransferase (PAPS reductase)/FAD synthetase
MERWQLEQLQRLPLEIKIIKTQQRIKEWYEKHDGKVYISFSGGKDSTVLLDIVRKIYPDIEAVFIDTGLEYPEIKEFVKTIDNVTTLKPKMNFKDVLIKYGYPVISKEQAQFIRQYRNAKSQKTKETRMNGNKWGMGKISEKWKYLLTAPFKISDECCNIMKKNPVKIYEKQTKNYPIIGVMACESKKRIQDYLKVGCNAFDAKRPISRPIGFWNEQDVLLYLKNYKIPYASVYGEIREVDGKLITTGATRTGCVFCLFGIHMEKEEINRMQRLKLTHPKIYDYCIRDLSEGGLGLGKVLDYIKIKY